MALSKDNNVRTGTVQREGTSAAIPFGTRDRLPPCQLRLGNEPPGVPSTERVRIRLPHRGESNLGGTTSALVPCGRALFAVLPLSSIALSNINQHGPRTTDRSRCRTERGDYGCKPLR